MYPETIPGNIKSKDQVKVRCDNCGKEYNNTWFCACRNLKKNEGKHICLQCSCTLKRTNNRKSPEKFLEQAIEKWGNTYDYSITKYVTKQIKIKFICKIHGEQEQYPRDHLKRGCDNCNSKRKNYNDEIYKREASKVHDNYYNYDKLKYNGMNEDILITCPVHGDFEQRAAWHLYQEGNCPKCAGGVKYDNDDFKELSSKKHNNKFDYSKTIYTKAHDKVIITCPIHGDFEKLAYMHLQEPISCPDCASEISSSIAEKEIVEYLKSIYNKEIICNNRKLLGNGKEIDIFLPDISLGIEFHGDYWHTEEYVERDYHFNKYKSAKDNGITLIQIFSHEWENKNEIVLSRLASLIGNNKRIFARNTEFVEISSADKNVFLNRTHIQGKDNSSINYGLIYEGHLVACMTFGKPRFAKDFDFELIRYSSELNINIVGGASKLLSHFSHKGKMISYADCRWSSGKMYEKLGFTFDGYTNIGYKYYNTFDKTLHNRMVFQKHKIKNMPFYEDALTEVEIMNLNNYQRLWNAGNSKWIKTID